MAITRRSFLAGLGSVSVGLLFHRKLDRVLESLERDLIDEPQTEGQLPSAAVITVMPQMTFRPRRLIVSGTCAHLFVIEDIRIGNASQLFDAGAVPASVPASVFAPGAFPFADPEITMATVGPGKEVSFRVRYVGKDPKGAQFFAALIGTDANGRGRFALPISSGVAITA